jgi:uncharacterized protein (DUF2062 family)
MATPHRRLKSILRFVPRRAVFHRYPVIGRFAGIARRRAYLWSLRTYEVRAAFYVGSVLSLLPVMGIQLPVAFALCLLLRCNLMVTGVLQLITNPLTAAPIYYGTWRVGLFALEKLGVELGRPRGAAPDLDPEELQALEETSQVLVWHERLGTVGLPLIVGGVLCGFVLGVLLDGLYLAFRRRAISAPVGPSNI